MVHVQINQFRDHIEIESHNPLALENYSFIVSLIENKQILNIIRIR